MSLRDRRLALVPALALVVLTAACGGSEDGDGGGGSSTAADTIPVAASDDSCDVEISELEAGTHEFEVTNGGSTTTEFYVYAEGDRVMAEVENIAPGLSRPLLVELPAGEYETACKPGMIGDGIRNPLTVTGESAELSEDESLAQAAEDYQRYVQSQTGALIERTTAFVDAVKAGDIEGAKALYPVARSYWERIEPVAEIFGDLDPAIDARVNDVAEGDEWTGYHRIEKQLWVDGNTQGMEPYADKLLADVRKVVALAEKQPLTALQLAQGSKALLDEVATGKITGEEDRYSHTDLWDFAANVEGSKAAIAALRPVLEKRDPDLLTDIDDGFARVDALLAEQRTDDGYVLYTALSQAEVQQFSDAVAALSESVSQVAAVVAGE
jgi:iron uptake system component EfeO